QKLVGKGGGLSCQCSGEARDQVLKCTAHVFAGRLLHDSFYQRPLVRVHTDDEPSCYRSSSTCTTNEVLDVSSQKIFGPPFPTYSADGVEDQRANRQIDALSERVGAKRELCVAAP